MVSGIVLPEIEKQKKVEDRFRRRYVREDGLKKCDACTNSPHREMTQL